MTTGDPNNFFRCIPGAGDVSETESAWLKQWLSEHPREQWELPDHQTEALALLIPMLLCGEQSAALIFNRETSRLNSQLAGECARAMASIENDELMHDQALQSVAAHLPRLQGQSRVKRRAQLFYARLGSDHDSIARLFTGIQHLDSCVCQIMHHVANSDIGKNHPFARLFSRIKRDEARHVLVSKRHAIALGADSALSAEVGRRTRQSLVDLLLPDAGHLETLGVDADKLFAGITRSRNSFG